MSVTYRTRTTLLGATARVAKTRRTGVVVELATEGPKPRTGTWNTAAPASRAPATTHAIDAANPRAVVLVMGTRTSGSGT
jgi:hypothetical protein